MATRKFRANKHLRFGGLIAQDGIIRFTAPILKHCEGMRIATALKKLKDEGWTVEEINEKTGGG